jgi:hypothetical protein
MWEHQENGFIYRTSHSERVHMLKVGDFDRAFGCGA